MRVVLLCIVLLLVFPVFSADCAEYELYKEILGHPLFSSRQSLAVDKDGFLWVCSGGLVFRYNGSNWENFTEISGGASLVSASPDGLLWFADGGNISCFNGIEWTYYSKDMEIPNSIQEISAGPDNTLWLVLYETGYYYPAKFDGNEILTYREGLLQKYIGRITATMEGGVWIVYNNSFDQIDCVGDTGDNCPKGISYFDGVNFYHYSDWNGLPISDLGWTDVQWIIQDPESGDMYANCNDDLYKFSNDSWSLLLSGSSVGMLSYGSDGYIWRGFLGILNHNRLAKLKNNQWYEYNMSEISSVLFEELKWPFSNTMAITPDGMVWIGFNVGSETNGGLLRISSSSLDITNVESDKPIIFSTRIFSYPNPFNPVTTITYRIVEPSRVMLFVYSITGQKVATLVDGHMSAGTHSVTFEGSNLASGMYFYRFAAEGFEKKGKMLLVK